MSKFLTESEMRSILEPIVASIKEQMVEVNKNAVETFYASASPGTYSRTMGLQNICLGEPDEEWDYDKCRLTYHYSSSGVDVNPWLSPWGIEYGGNPEIAFTKAYDEGYHGGPKPLGDGWTWSMTQQSDPIYNLLISGISSITI